MISPGFISLASTDHNMPGPTVYTTDEAAEILKVSKKTIIRMIHAGRIRAVKLAREYRLTEEQIREFLEENST